MNDEDQKNALAPTSWYWRQCIFLFNATKKLTFAGLLASSVSSLLRFDHFGLGMFFTYAPRILWLVVAAVFFVAFLARRRIAWAAIIAACSLLLIYDSPWGGGAKAVEGDTLTLLSFNTHAASSEDIAKICDTHNVDVLSLQEASIANTQALKEKYAFFAGDRNIDFEYKDDYVFTCVVGIRRSLLATDPGAVEVQTAITGYRTLAVVAQLKTGPLCIVNVHTTKPAAVSHSLRFVCRMTPTKARRHCKEHQALQSWLKQQEAIPILLAGDFNAPGNTCNLRFPGFKNAQRESGEGFHLTFPAKFPIFGIDHVLGNNAIEFLSYDVLNTGVSDHRAQLTRLRFRSE